MHNMHTTVPMLLAIVPNLRLVLSGSPSRLEAGMGVSTLVL